MRIVMLSPHPHLRGPLPKHTPLLVRALGDAGCEVVSEPWGRHSDDESPLGKLPRLVGDIRRIRRVLAGRPFDVMVLKTSHEWKSLLRDIPLLVASRRRVPSVIVQFHGGRSDELLKRGRRAFKLASRLLLACSDGVLVLSTEEARELQRFYPKGRFRVVANPYAPKHRSGEAPQAARTPTLVFASRLVAEKGIIDLLDALSLMSGGASCRLVVCGSGPAEAAVRERVRELELDGRVVFAGHLPESQLADTYRSADAFVLPTYWGEGFPTAISEAMDAGLPIVTTRTRGIADHLEQDVNALFVPQRDPRALAAALERILRDADLRASMGAANRKKVQQFAPTRVASDYRRALEEIVASAGKSS